MAVSVEVKALDIMDAKMPIVHAANNFLKVGGILKDAAGDALQQECDKLIAANGGKSLPIGAAVVTKGGNLSRFNILYVIHAIGIRALSLSFLAVIDVYAHRCGLG